MRIIKWLKSFFSNRAKAQVIYRQGLARAKTHDPNGAIKAYTQVIDMFSAPLDIISMALFNRGLVYTANGETAKGTCDLKEVLAMVAAPERVKTMARQKLIRMKNRLEETSPGAKQNTNNASEGEV